VNGAEALAATLVTSGVDTVFANPGTSEMHFVAALDSAPGLKGVLCLFEGVATGAADGYARMAERPAATLLHLGPGLANGIANLHDARRARTPIVNVIGDHATYHKRFDAPLETDIDALAGAVSVWVRRSARPQDVGPDAAAAVEAASQLQGVASLILPGDASWENGGVPAAARPTRPRGPVADEVITDAVKAINSGEPVAVLLGGPALRLPVLRAAERLRAMPGVRMLTETFCPRMERGAGRPGFDRLGYFAEMAAAQLEGVRHLVLAGAASPVAFFAYPGKASSLVPEGCEVHVLAEPLDDLAGSLEALLDRLGADRVGAGVSSESPALVPEVPALAPLSPQSIGAVVGARLPEGAILVDEAITAGWALATGTVGAAPHDLIAHTGGAIGQGLPLATGAALACPGRRVVSVEADGSAAYTIQALWTQAREGLDVTTVVVANRAYAILQIEMQRVEAQEPGPVARSLLDLGSPPVDFVSVARGFGIPAVSVSTTEEFDAALGRSLSTPGPMLIEAVTAK
jgi:acetolactate synthase-1/2/3 large subunit